MTETYEVELEIEGPVAMFTRPDTGGTPTSYPVPTWSAAKGIFESVAFLSGGEAWIDPIYAEVCRRVGNPGGEIRFQSYVTNYGGPLRKDNQRAQGSSFQLFATVLVGVCYRFRGLVRFGTNKPHNSINTRHYLQHLFNRRIKQGRCHRTPCLGWSEFTASYWGVFRDGKDGNAPITERDVDLNLRLPSMLHNMFDSPINGSYSPHFRRDLEVRQGLLTWHLGEDTNVT